MSRYMKVLLGFVVNPPILLLNREQCLMPIFLKGFWEFEEVKFFYLQLGD
jgi:hypothetical protein